MSTMVWLKVESLGDQIFLLGRSSASLSASEFGMIGNCIYFFFPGYTNWYKFHMDDGTITTTFLSTLKLPHWCEPFWVVPDHKLQVNNKYASKAITGKNYVPKFGDKGKLNTEERSWKDLPIEILQLVVASLCQCDCIRFQLTCKTLISITPPLRSNYLLVQFNHGPPKLPWLMSFPKINKGECNFYNPISSNVYKMDLHKLAGAIIRDANYGWLLMSQGENSIFFFNPLTEEIINLPDMCYRFAGISFSSPPTSADCIVFGITNFYGIVIYCKEEDTWSSYEHFHNNQVQYVFMAGDCNPIFCDGVFYCLSKDGRLGIFDPKETEDDLIWRVLPGPPDFSFLKFKDFQTNFTGFLVEHEGEILSVYEDLLGKSVCVYKLDRVAMKWVKLESLGDKMLFLSPTKSILMPAELKRLENRIYLPRFDGENSMVYHCFGIKRCHGYRRSTREPTWNCTWIQMTNSDYSNGLRMKMRST